jgi:hypothetical protein
MLLLVVIVGVAGLVAGCLYARERRRRLTAEAHVEGCRLAARVAIRDRDAAVAERDEWAKHAGEARGDAENARRDLATARQDFEIRGRSSGRGRRGRPKAGAGGGRPAPRRPDPVEPVMS